MIFIQKKLIYIVAAAIILIIGLIYFFSQKNLKTKEEMEAFEKQKLIESVTAPKEAETSVKILKDLTAPKPYKIPPQDIINSLTAPTK